MEAAGVDLFESSVFFLTIVQKNELLSVLYKGTVNCFLVYGSICFVSLEIL